MRVSAWLAAMTLTLAAGCGSAGSGSDRTPVIGDHGKAIHTLSADMDGNGALDKVFFSSTAKTGLNVLPPTQRKQGKNIAKLYANSVRKIAPNI